MNVNNNINSAILSATLGIQRGFEGVTQSAVTIAQNTANNNDAASTEELLQNAATQQIANIRDTLPQGADNITNAIVGLQVNATAVQASAKVLDVANDTIGRIIDELV